MNRRGFFRWFASFAAVAVASRATTSYSVNVPDLKEQLEKDLKARLPSEFRFIAVVVGMVKQDALPLSLVNSTHLWARRKPRNRMEYFEFALRERARRLGIEIESTAE